MTDEHEHVLRANMHMRVVRCVASAQRIGGRAVGSLYSVARHTLRSPIVFKRLTAPAPVFTVSAAALNVLRLVRPSNVDPPGEVEPGDEGLREPNLLRPPLVVGGAKKLPSASPPYWIKPSSAAGLARSSSGASSRFVARCLPRARSDIGCLSTSPCSDIGAFNSRWRTTTKRFQI